MSFISELDCRDVLNFLEHTPKWHSDRAQGVGGSDAGIIASGDAERMEALRLIKCGKRQADDLSNVLAVQMGSWTEALNRLWLSRALGLDIEPGESTTCKCHSFMRANTDGRASDGGIVECKHTSAWTKAADVLPRYYPQVQHCLHVTGAPHAYLSVFMGSDKHIFQRIDRDEKYIDALIAAERAFWSYVVTGASLVEARGVKAAPAPQQSWREVDMTGSNEWATHAEKWLANRDGAIKFDAATSELKALVESDMKCVYGYGVVAVRDGRGVTIKAESK